MQVASVGAWLGGGGRRSQWFLCVRGIENEEGFPRRIFLGFSGFLCVSFCLCMGAMEKKNIDGENIR